MNFSSAVRYINKLPSVKAGGGEKATPSLLRFSLLMRMLGDPHKQIESVTVLGELGRTGVSSAVAAMLMSEGYRTGLLNLDRGENYRECFRINGAPVSVADFVTASARVIECARQIQKSYDNVKKGADTASGINAITQLFDARGISPVLAREELLAAIGTLVFPGAGCRLTVISEIEGGGASPLAAFPAPVAALVLSSVGERSDRVRGEMVFFPERTGEVVLEPVSSKLFGVISQGCIERGARLTLTASASIRLERRTLIGSEFSYKKYEGLYVPSISSAVVPRCAAITELAEALTRRGFKISERAVREGISKYESADGGDVFFVCAEPAVIMVDPQIDGAALDGVISFMAQIKSREGGTLYIIDSEVCPEDVSAIINGVRSGKWSIFDRVHISTHEPERYPCEVSEGVLPCSLEACDTRAIAESLTGLDAVLYFCPVADIPRRKENFISDFEHRHIKRGRK